MTNILVVSTVMSGLLFARFPTVDYVNREGGKWSGKVKLKEKRIKRKQSLSLTHCAVVSNTHISHDNDDITKESHYCVTQSTKGKRTKRGPDITVETTKFPQNYKIFPYLATLAQVLIFFSFRLCIQIRGTVKFKYQLGQIKVKIDFNEQNKKQTFNSLKIQRNFLTRQVS